jgi:hypothetical protein
MFLIAEFYENDKNILKSFKYEYYINFKFQKIKYFSN